MTLKEQAESLLKDLNDCHEEKCEDCKYYAGECMSELVDKAAELIQKLYNILYVYSNDNTSENLDGRENDFLDGSINQTDFLDRERMRV